MEEANWTKDWRRTMDIMVVLFVQLESCATKMLASEFVGEEGDVGGEKARNVELNIQNSDTKHHHDVYLLLHRE